MYFKLVVFGACLALAASASIPSDPSLVDLRDANNNSISKAEADQLLPRLIRPFKIPSFEPSPHVLIRPFIPRDGFTLIRNINRNRRVRRSADAFETKDAYYVQFADDQSESSRAKRQLKVQDSASLFKPQPRPSFPLINRIDIQPQPRPSFWDNNKLNIQGGGSLSKGINIKAEGIAKLWESNNQRNSLQGTVQYKQQLGGPSGSSQPNIGGGFIFKHRF